jgi:hypothetical protein
MLFDATQAAAKGGKEMKELTAFSWGYWGWGNHTREFVRAVDAIERDRGIRPPMFVDIRFSRSVRALGFRNTAFEEAVGKSRYRWLPKLGNKRIGSGRGGIQIADLSGVDELLQIVLDAATDNRRVIFFCACERPGSCHRAVVASLLVKAARRKGVPLNVVEWPGGEPETIDIDIPDKVVKDVLRGGNRVPLAASHPKQIRKFAALPWCSRVGLHSSSGVVAIICGPAQLAADWYLPVIGPDVSKPGDTIKSLRKEAERLRKSLGFRPVA